MTTGCLTCENDRSVTAACCCHSARQRAEDVRFDCRGSERMQVSLPALCSIKAQMPPSVTGCAVTQPAATKRCRYESCNAAHSLQVLLLLSTGPRVVLMSSIRCFSWWQVVLFPQACSVVLSPSGLLFNVHSTTISKAEPFLCAARAVNGTESWNSGAHSHHCSHRNCATTAAGQTCTRGF